MKITVFYTYILFHFGSKDVKNFHKKQSFVDFERKAVIMVVTSVKKRHKNQGHEIPLSKRVIS
jgi:hypothetical protein